MSNYELKAKIYTHPSIPPGTVHKPDSFSPLALPHHIYLNKDDYKKVIEYIVSLNEKENKELNKG